MKKNILLMTLIVLLIHGCKSGCQEVREYCLPLSYYFKILTKSQDNRFFEFKGVDKKNKNVVFRETKHWNIYDAIEIGDTLVKKSGETEIILIKKDTTLVFPLICGGSVIDKNGKIW